MFNKGINLFYAFIQNFHPKRIKILMLHEIVSDSVMPELLQLTSSNFNFLLDKIKINGNVIGIEEFCACFKNNNFNGEYVITFDDVYDSVYHWAFPLLIANNIPFTLFVNVSLLDTPGYITKKQLLEMSQNKLCTVGSHGVHHMFFRNLTKKECAKELLDSKLALEKIIKMPVEFFAFPYGSLVAVSFSNVKEVTKYGYRMSFSTIPSGVWHSFFINYWFIPRINVTQKMIQKI